MSWGLSSVPRNWRISGLSLPDLLEQGAVGDDFGDAGEADLVVAVVHVAELDLGIGGDLGGLVIDAADWRRRS